jgi:SAM-dependent methyltransferase
MSDDSQARYESEQAFHDHTFEHASRARVAPFYKVLKPCATEYQRVLHGLAGAGVAVLEYGCGTGTDAFALARTGAAVSAIDLSEVGIRKAREEAEREGLTVECRQMNAESLDYPPNSFDIVCGRGILHHLDLELAFGQLQRVLRPEGHALFMEPLGHNPLINTFRRFTPSIRTPDEHPLFEKDVETARRYFARVDVRYFCLFALLALPAVKLRQVDALLKPLWALDGVLLPRLGRGGRFGWYAILQLSEPLPVVQ